MNDQPNELIKKSHHRSRTRLPMPIRNRAAQFAPFAALSGYEGVIREVARLTAPQRELAADKIEELDLRLQQLLHCKDAAPQVCITWFVPDRYKTGGSLRTANSAIKNIDPARRMLVLSDDTELPLDAITDITGDMWDKF